jgi:hypothetical protein
VRDAGKEHVVEVAQHGREGLGLVGRLLRERGTDVARLDGGQDG